MQDLNLAAGLEITSIRLVLKAEDNHAIKADDSRCEMQTPSGQQSGIKIHLAQSFTLENSAVYSMVMDFDAEKSVVVKGNGDCLLKPVLKLLQVTKTAVDPGPSPIVGDGSDPVIVIDPVTDGTDSNSDPAVGSDPTTGGGGGFEIPVDPINEPAVISPVETFTL